MTDCKLRSGVNWEEALGEKRRKINGSKRRPSCTEIYCSHRREYEDNHLYGSDVR